MKAIAYKTPGPIDREGALQDITLEKPIAADRDLLIKIHAVSINPVDTKQRKAGAYSDSMPPVSSIRLGRRRRISNRATPFSTRARSTGPARTRSIISSMNASSVSRPPRRAMSKPPSHKSVIMGGSTIRQGD
jgi:hypothetical protein